MMHVRRPAKTTSRSKNQVFAALLGLAALSGCSDDSGAQGDLDQGPACIGKCDGFSSVTGALPLAPHAATWDGRVLLADVEGACRVVAVHPEAIGLQDGGVLSFGSGVFSAGQPCPTSVGNPALAMATSTGENPFRSNADGSPDLAGGHLTYLVSLVEGNDAGQLVRRSGTIVTSDADVVSATWDQDPTDLDIEGAHPTLSADGGLMVFERDETLWFALATDDGFGPVAPLSQLHARAAESFRGLPLATHYPLAGEALRAADGTIIAAGAPVVGQRPALGQDGTSLFFEAEGGTRVLSQRTGFALRQLDGRINAGSDDAPSFRISLGRSGSVYAPYPGAYRLPVREHRLPTVSLIGFTEREGGLDSTYDEIDFVAFTDKEYATYLPMTEAALANGTLDGQHAADLSGRFNNAALDAGTTFGNPAVPGAHGQAAFMVSGAGMHIPASEGTSAPQRGWNVSMFVRPMAGDLTGPLLDWDGVVNVSLAADGVAVRALTTEGEAASTSNVPLPQDTWTHLSVSFDGNSGRMRIFINGERVSQDQFVRRSFPAGEGGAITLGRATSSGQGPVLGLDEVSVSRTYRFDEEVFAEAQQEELFRRPIASLDRLREDVDAPLGIDLEQYIMPNVSNVGEEIVELGTLLFFDPRFSRNGEVSCATCHDPARAFTDGRPVGPHIDGGDLNRATPTIFNRALSMSQFWDARTATLEQQALLPIFSAPEMNFTREETLALLLDTPEYVDRFNAVFGREPSLSMMSFAISAFERSQLAGDSPVDRFEAGETDALTDAERRGRNLFHGKARCVACHSGSNYSDEALHVVGILDDDDVGAFLSRRGREGFLFAFKTPTLRNIDVTGPYFHNGAVETLEEVVALYVAGPDAGTENVDPESRALDLSADEEADLVAFLRALTSPNAVQTFDIELPQSE